MDTARATNYKLMTYATGSTPQNRRFYNYFAEEYNNASKSSPVQALSQLSQIKDDIRQERDRIYEYIEYVKEILSELTSTISSDNQTLFYRKVTIDETIAFIQRGCYKVYEENKFVVDGEELKETVQYIEKAVDDKPLVDFNELIENVFKRKEELVYVNAQYVGLTDVISDIIRSGYPDELKTYDSDEKYEEAQASKNVGRPLDESAPQDKIEIKVQELARLKRFQNADGKPKPTTIRDYIMNSFPELMGEISERTLFDRVKRALKKLGMQ